MSSGCRQSSRARSARSACGRRPLSDCVAAGAVGDAAAVDVDEFVAHYPRVFHMTELASWETIGRHGLLSVSALLDLFDSATSCAHGSRRGGGRRRCG